MRVPNTRYTARVKFDGPVLNDRWRLGPRMSAGAQAQTYVARDEADPLGQRIAVLKQFRLQKGSWKDFDLFEREVRVLKNLRHPGIPQFIESFESEPGVYNLVMERMKGASVRAIATKARFTDDELRDLMSRVLEILDYLHRRRPPVIHRDIKPANLIRNAEGKISLVDFGGVRDALRGNGGSTVVGTFGYMAPEQLHGEATPATDVYGLGATIVSLAGGVEPEDVPRKGLRMELDKHLRSHDPQLVQLLAAMTEPDPEKRPESARAVLRLLARQKKRPKAPRRLSPAKPRRDDDGALVATPERDDKPTPFSEMGEMIAAVPQPFAAVLRVVLGVFAIGGHVAVALLQSVLLPLVFAMVSSSVSKKSQRKVESTRKEVMGALEEGRRGFRDLQRLTLGRDGDRKRLPK